MYCRVRPCGTVRLGRERWRRAERFCRGHPVLLSWRRFEQGQVFAKLLPLHLECRALDLKGMEEGILFLAHTGGTLEHGRFKRLRALPRGIDAHAAALWHERRLWRRRNGQEYCHRPQPSAEEHEEDYEEARRSAHEQAWPRRGRGVAEAKGLGPGQRASISSIGGSGACVE